MFYQQGDVLIKETDEVRGEKLNHLTLAQGTKTGHHHTVTKGKAELYKDGDDLFLKVEGKTATLTHQEHKPIPIKKGIYKIEIVKEYDHFAEEARNVAD